MSVISDELCQLILFHIKYLCHGKRIVFCKCIAFDILKIITDATHFFHHFNAGSKSVRPIWFKRRKTQILLDIDNCINTEAGNPFFQPPVDHLINLLAKLLILPVQIRLFLREKMQIIHVRSRHRFPDAASKIGTPVIWHSSIFSFHEVKISGIFPVRILQCLLKPFMFVRTMIHHQIHDHIHIPLLCLRQKFIKVLHGAKFFSDIIII